MSAVSRRTGKSGLASSFPLPRVIGAHLSAPLSGQGLKGSQALGEFREDLGWWDDYRLSAGSVIRRSRWHDPPENEAQSRRFCTVDDNFPHLQGGWSGFSDLLTEAILPDCNLQLSSYRTLR